jgi:hypothetical protein
MSNEIEIAIPALVATIKAHLAKGAQSLEKSEQHYVTAGLRLKELKARKPSETPWPEYVRKTFNLGQSRADELIRISDGRTTVAETRLSKATSTAKSKAKSSATGADSSQLTTDAPQEDQPHQIADAVKAMASKLSQADDDDSDDDEQEGVEDRINPENPENYRAAFLLRAGHAAHMAAYSGPEKFIPSLLDPARKAAAAWTAIVERFDSEVAAAAQRKAKRVAKVKASPQSDIDRFAESKAELEREHEEYREEMLKRVALNAPLLAPITPEKEQAYTRLIKTRQLYEGACDLSWVQYSKYRDQHPECAALTADDLDYAGMWTAVAIKAGQPDAAEPAPAITPED